MDDQEKYQVREIAKTMATPGWAFLLAAWAQKREVKILGQLKRARVESHWRFHQGRLEGFDEAATLAETLTAQLESYREEKESEAERKRVVEELTGGQS
jgi:hypothetical protein